MKLTDLHPAITGAHDGLNEFVMDCPVCGDPWKCSFFARLDKSDGAAHSWTYDRGSPDITNSITVTPSVNYVNGSAHGRKRDCHVHFSITKGEVILS